MESGSDNVQPIRMLPPPPRTFKDREDLITYARDFGVNHGYIVTIKNSKRESDVYLCCDRGGITRKRSIGEPKRKRKVPSRLTNCPFELVGRKDDDVWVLRIKNGEHNHEPMKDMSEHPYSRRFTEDEVKVIKEMIEAGAKPKEVLETLKKTNPEIQSTSRHVYNLKARISQGKFSETSFKSWKPNAGASSYRTNPLKVSNFIGGNFVDSKGTVLTDVINPATHEVVAQVPSATHEEFKSAVFAAKQAFRSWRNTPLSARQRLMVKLSELIRRDIDKLALVISTEQGETIKRAHACILHSLEVVEHACGNRALQMGEFVPNALTEIDMNSIREPLGVCAGICQSNYPAVVPLWMFPVSIICGNTFVLKPSEKCPGASMKLVELATEAGLPDGVLNIVHGGDDIVDHICGDDDIKAISFVGSYTTAAHIYAQAAARGKRVEANIRSKNQAVVMPDACMDTTLDALVAAGFGASGDPCMSLRSIIFVGRSSPWVEELVKRAAELKVSEGTEETTDIGAVINGEVKAKICRSVQAAIERGARLILDGRNIMVPVYEEGSFVGPTILSGITPMMEWFEEDLVGPLLLCTQVSSLEDAITVVNQQKAKTGASIFTTSCFAAKKFQNEVEAGLVGINVPLSIPLPFCSTGLTTSFVGNHNFYGKAGVLFYTQVKLVAQQWRGLTTKRISSIESSTPEMDLTYHPVPMSMQLPSDSSHESSSSDAETTDKTSTSKEGAPVTLCQVPDINFSLPQRSNFPETLASTSWARTNVLKGPERNSVPGIAQTSEDVNTPVPVSSYMPLPPPQNGVSNSSSLRTYIHSPLGDASIQSFLPTTTSHTLRISDAIRLSTVDRVNMPGSSHMHQSSDGSSMYTSRGVGREYIPTPSHWNNGSFSERAYAQMPSESVANMLRSQGPDTHIPTAGDTSQRLK